MHEEKEIVSKNIYLTIKGLRSRLAEVEKKKLESEAANSYLKRRLDDATMESDAAIAKLGNELFKARERLTAAEKVIEVAREGYSFRHELEEYDATK